MHNSVWSMDYQRYAGLLTFQQGLEVHVSAVGSVSSLCSSSHLEGINGPRVETTNCCRVGFSD